MASVEYPEHEKLAAVAEESRAIGQFLEWLAAHPDLCLGRWRKCNDKGEPLVYWRLEPEGCSPEALLASYFGIDTTRLEREKQAMFAMIHAAVMRTPEESIAMPRRRGKSFDTKCWELAKFFLKDEGKDTDENIRDLVQLIQNTVEEFLVWLDLDKLAARGWAVKGR